MSDNFASWLRQKRTSKKLTQQELSERANEEFKQSYISALERGIITDPAPFYLDRIATALGESRSEVYKAAGRSLKEEQEVITETVPGTTSQRFVLSNGIVLDVYVPDGGNGKRPITQAELLKMMLESELQNRS